MNIGSGAAERALNDNENSVVYTGSSGLGFGKQIVFLAGDHEYRGEESLPALARILAKRYGFKCTVIFTTNPESGEIEPGSSHISNLSVLRHADLMVVFLRFQHFEDEQMAHIEAYLQTGKPVLGLRTSTHAFAELEGTYAKFNEGYVGHAEDTGGKGEEWKHGFGEWILGEHWVGHYGRNHVQSSNLLIEAEQVAHPILRGVGQPHAKSGGYVGHPAPGSLTLARGQILDGMTPDAPATQNPEQQELYSVAWVRNYQPGNPRARVFASTHGASEDLNDAAFRRMLINAHLWCLGMDEQIKATNPIGFVGLYNPSTFNFNGYRRGVKPADIAGFESPIYDASKPTSAD